MPTETVLELLGGVLLGSGDAKSASSSLTGAISPLGCSSRPLDAACGSNDLDAPAGPAHAEQ
ncbi:UNVERIFIED_CONTAM: hypothetical protein LK11_22920 [Mumia flava]